MRRSLLVAAVMVLVAGVVVSLAAGGPLAAPKERWVIRDLGTLGGPWSDASAISGRGRIVGQADWTAVTAGGDDFVDLHAFLWEKGKMRDLGTLGAPDSAAWAAASAINGRGQVVGWVEPRAGDSFFHAFLWEGGTMTDLGTLGGRGSLANDINDRGQVVGTARTADGRERAFLWEDGTMRDLGAPGGRRSGALAINERGQIVGWATYSTNGRVFRHAVLWVGGSARDLGTLGGPSSVARDINEQGQIVGGADTRTRNERGYPVHHAFLWQSGKMRDLGRLKGPGSEAYAINNRGQVVGSADTGEMSDVGPIRQAFLWERGRMLDLGTISNGRTDRWDFSVANDINDRGRIVGQSSSLPDGDPHAALWTKTG